MNAPFPQREIRLSVSAALYSGLGKMAKASGLSASAMAERLFMAAYTARCKPTGDKALDDAVAAIGAAQSGEEERLRNLLAARDATIAGLRTSFAEARAPLEREVARLTEALLAAPKPRSDDAALVEKLQAELAERDTKIAELNAEMANKIVNDHAEDLTTLRHMIAERNRRIEGLTDKLTKADSFAKTVDGKLKRATDAATELEKEFEAKLAEAAARIAALEKAPQRAPSPAVIVEAIPSPADELLMWLFAFVDTADLADLVGKPESTIANMRSEWRSARAKRRAA